MYGHSSISDASAPFEFSQERIRINLAQACVDTLVNKISKNQPRATFLTDDGDWDKQQHAKKRERFVYGQMFKSDVYKKTPKAALQALSFGDGLVKIYREGKEIKVDPVLTPSIFIDENEAVYGDPKTWFEVRYIDRETLKELCPGHEEAIDNAPSAMMPFYMHGIFAQNLVEVVEYWRLASKKGEKDGEHHIIIGDKSIFSESWSTRPPFRKIGFIQNISGFWSKGAIEIITPYQIEANRTAKRIQDCLRLVATPKVLYEYQSKIVKAHFNNDVGAMIGYAGTPPTFITPSAVSPELFRHLQWCIQSAYNDVGISALSVRSEKPAGLNSGKALREFYDIETERFAAFGRAWEQLHIEIAQDCLEVAKEIQEKFGKYSVLSPDPKGCEVIDFSEIDMDSDAYLIQVYPTSQLPKDPEGRLEYVQELIAGQMIDPEIGLSLLDFPDTEKFTSLKTSELDDIIHTVDFMLTKDQYLPPEPYQNLELGITLMKKSYLKYKNKGCPDEKLDLLVRWIDDALLMMNPPEEPVMTGDELSPVAEVSEEDAMLAEQAELESQELPLEGQEAIMPMP